MMQEELEVAVIDRNVVEDLNCSIESSGENEPDPLYEIEENTENDASSVNIPPKSTKKMKVSTTNAKKKPSCLRTVQCPICSKKVANKYSLKSHIEAVHEKKKPFTCTHCPKAFNQKQQLIDHIAHRHTFENDNTSNSNRPFKCTFDGCGKFFKTKTNLKLHQKTH
jgi:uncharacterized Zn-finger protein